ncbi:uncharacterized protein dbr isoform X2 [Eurosta solidaginis]
MERQSSAFEYLCRVCAANTKGKNSVAECVYILKTPALKDKIERYLYLTIPDDDILPKVLCKACFRQVEATASLSKIAKHTQKVFRDFIFSTKSYEQAESSNENSTSTVAATNSVAAPPPAPVPVRAPSFIPTPTPTPPATNYAPPMQPPAERPKRRERKKEEPQVINADASPPPAHAPPPSSACTHKDDVIVNVSVNDPLTRETQHKIISASRHRQNSIDTRYTPKSIAQRCFPNAPTGPSPSKNQPTSGVINFFPNGPQQVTTITSGGYVIGPSSTLAENNTTNAAVTEITTPVPVNNSSNSHQKRRNLKNTLSNSKPPNDGQVSLLKSSHKATPTQQQQLRQDLTAPAPPPKVVETSLVPTLLVEDDVTVDPLPEKIIIAATKQQKHQVQAAPAPPPLPPPPQSSAPTEVVEVLDLVFSEEPQTEPTDLSQHTKTNIPDDILLGKVIKDLDLLKLILKALKWPVNKHTMEDQLNRLRNSRFANIMADPNLLQDADLTQIMGPYLGPVLQAAQLLQQQQIAAAAAAAAALTKETELQVAGITSALPYKLPAETSVQLVPASPDAEDVESSDLAVVKGSDSSQKLKRNAAKTRDGKTVQAKKPRKSSTRGRSTSVFNNDDYATLNSALTSQYLNSKSAPDFGVDLDPASLFAHLGMLSGLSASSSNEALLALLQRQRVALSRMHQAQQQQKAKPRSRRQRANSIITVPASGSDFLFDTDDIILMEPDDGIVSTTTNSQNTTLTENVTLAGSTSTNAPSERNIVFTMPQQQIPQPIITRPIIKRRKTVIQASPACMNLAINAQDLTSTTPSTQQVDNVMSSVTTAPPTSLTSTSVTNIVPTAAPQNKLSKTRSFESLNVIATQYPSNIISIGTQAPSNTTQASEAVVCAPISTKATETTITETATAATSVTSLAATSNVTTVSGPNGKGRSNTRSRSASNRRQPTSKAALGQQLLEAIVLQKVASETNNSKDMTVAASAAVATPASSRGSVQQIRSALKKSLQKAQEHQQQQQRNKKSAALTITEEVPNQNIVREVVVQPRNKHAADTPVGELDVEEEINKITLVLQSSTAKDDKKIKEGGRRLSPTKIPGIRRKVVPATRNPKSAVVLVADEIVDLLDDEDIQDTADGKNKDEKEKEARSVIIEKGDNEVHSNEATRNAKTVSPTRQRRRKLKPEEVQVMVDEDDDYDEEDDKPLKPRTVKNVNNYDNHEEDESPNRAGTPRQRNRQTPANGRRAPSERDYDKESDGEEASFKNDNESIASSNVSTRPSRASKTMSRYYKGPDKSPSTPRRSTTISTRRSRVR